MQISIISKNVEPFYKKRQKTQTLIWHMHNSQVQNKFLSCNITNINYIDMVLECNQNKPFFWAIMKQNIWNVQSLVGMTALRVCLLPCGKLAGSHQISSGHRI